MNSVQNIQKQNELEVTDKILKLILILPAFLLVTIILNVLGFFMLTTIQLILVVSVGIPGLVIPPLYKKNIISLNLTKILMIIYFSFFAMISYGVAFTNVYLLLLIPFLIAANYFSVKLIRLCVILTVPAFIGGELLASSGKLVVEAANQWIPLHTVIYIIQIIIVSMFFFSLAKRATNMLNTNAQFIEEQKEVFQTTDGMSKELSEYVISLEREMAELNDSVNNISSMIQAIAHDTEILFDSIMDASSKVDAIETAITDNGKKANEIADEIILINESSNKTKEELFNSVNEIKKIESYADKTKKAINLLKDRSKDINESISLITYISDETNLLSLNASIEAARAGQFGKGFMVVASEVKKLADQSSNSAQDIGDILKKVTESSDQANGAINDTYDVVIYALSLIDATVTTFEDMIRKQEHLKSEAQGIHEHSDSLQTISDEIKEKIEVLTDKTKSNFDKITNIASSIHQIQASYQTVTDNISNVSSRATELSRMNE